MAELSVLFDLYLLSAPCVLSISPVCPDDRDDHDNHEDHDDHVDHVDPDDPDKNDDHDDHDDHDVHGDHDDHDDNDDLAIFSAKGGGVYPPIPLSFFGQNDFLLKRTS